MSNVSLIPGYETRLFTDIFPNYDEFIEAFQDFKVFNVLHGMNNNLVYNLLYAQYGNSPIANSDENQFKAKLFSIIFKYGPTWEKELEIQENLRDLSEDELAEGTRAIYNHALNPGTDPSTQSLEELTYIDSQNTTNYKKSKMDRYENLLALLKRDVTSEFINRFNVLFKKFVSPHTYLYVTEEEEI